MGRAPHGARHGLPLSVGRERASGQAGPRLSRHRKIVFMHGCFWHAHGCMLSRKAPATHRRFWKEKFARNVARDRKVLRQLWSDGWQVLVVWECETKGPVQLQTILTAFLAPSEERT